VSDGWWFQLTGLARAAFLVSAAGFVEYSFVYFTMMYLMLFCWGSLLFRGAQLYRVMFR